MIFELRHSLTPEELQRLRFWILILFNLPGLWFFSLAFRGWQIQTSISRDGRLEATARVVAFTEFSVGTSGLKNSSARHYWPILEFEDQRGNKVRFTPLFKEFSSKTLPEIGTEYQIVYSSRTPETAQIKDGSDHRQNILIGLASGLFFLLFSLIAYWILGRFFIVSALSTR